MEIVMKGEIITMKKKLALLLALVMVCISVLSGCGGELLEQILTILQ